MTAVAIIIGCWEQHTHPIHRQLYQNIVNNISKNNDIQTVILSSCHTPIDNSNQGLNLWFEHEKRIFLDEQGIDWIRRAWVTAKENNKTAKIADVSKIILHNDWKDKFCVSLSEQWQLSYFLNIEPVTEVWYYGVGWNFGVQRDPIGWGQLCDLVKFKQIMRPIKILTQQSCTLVNTEPNSNKSCFECHFEYPDFSGTDWVQQSDGNYLKSTYDWDSTNLNTFIKVDQNRI